MAQVPVLHLTQAASLRLTAAPTLQTIEGHPYLPIEITVPIDLRMDQSILLRIEFRPDRAQQVSSTGVRDVLPLLRGRVAIEPVPATDLP